MKQGAASKGERGDATVKLLAALAAENARRVPCSICGLRILDMARHLSLVHDGGSDG